MIATALAGAVIAEAGTGPLRRGQLKPAPWYKCVARARVFAASPKFSWAIRWMIVKIAVRIVVGKLTGKRWVTAGAALQERMLQAVTRTAAELRTGSPVTEILLEEDRVVGVAYERDGTTRTVGARLGVIVNAGGFGHNHYLGDPFFTDGPNRTMGRIDTPPYYAVEVIPADVGTYGGVVTDAKARVLRADNSPIEGLYACGTSTASPMGRVYPGAGASVEPSMTFGWIAARHAAGLDNQPVPSADAP